MAYEEVKKALQELVLKHTTAPAEVISDIRFMMSDTDQFHTDQFHEVDADNDRDDNYEAMFGAYEEIREGILEYYANPLNFPPRTTQHHIVIKELDEVTDGEFKQILETCT